MIFSCTFIASIPIELLSSPTSYILLSLSLLLSYPLFLPLLFSPLTSSLLSSPPPLPLPLLFSLTSTSLSNLSPSLSFFKANYYRWRTSRPGLWDARCREQRSFLYCYHFFYCSVLFCNTLPDTDVICYIFFSSVCKHFIRIFIWHPSVICNSLQFSLPISYTLWYGNILYYLTLSYPNRIFIIRLIDPWIHESNRTHL